LSQKFSVIEQTVFFFLPKSLQNHNFSLRTTKFCQNQPKGKPHEQEKSHDAATYMKVAMKVFPGLSLCGWHCMYVNFQESLEKLFVAPMWL
jgi:hypothetical protein